MKLSKEEFVERAYLYEGYPADGLDTWECAAHYLLWEYHECLFPTPLSCKDKQKYLAFDWDTEFESMVYMITGKLKYNFDNDEEAMLEALNDTN